MLPFISPISLLRYLVVWRINRSLVQLPACLSQEISQVLGTFIARRLPTREAREWRKALGERGGATPEETANRRTEEREAAFMLPPSVSYASPWPVEAVLWVYPGKRTCGPGELVLWELKLLGTDADHGLFLELLLPAMEEAATTSDSQWRQSHSLWGHFDIQAVYAARGLRWEPVVQEGKLDLGYRASPTQWMEGLTLGAEERRHFHCLNWITPFDLQPTAPDPTSRRRARPSGTIPPSQVPTLQDLVEALLARLTVFLPGPPHPPEAGWTWVEPAEQAALRLALQELQEPAPLRHDLKPAPKGWPGRWIGSQTFSLIPPRLVPYLELASILHVGQKTHFGCGTFKLELFSPP